MHMTLRIRISSSLQTLANLNFLISTFISQNHTQPSKHYENCNYGVYCLSTFAGNELKTNNKHKKNKMLQTSKIDFDL